MFLGETQIDLLGSQWQRALHQLLRNPKSHQRGWYLRQVDFFVDGERPIRFPAEPEDC